MHVMVSIVSQWVHLLQEKLRRRLASVEVKVMNPPRQGKKVVVLDIVSVVCRCQQLHIAVSHFAAGHGRKIILVSEEICL